MNKDIFTLLGGFLTAVLLFLGTIGISFDWFTQESINAFVIMVGAFVALAINLYAVWKNTYASKKAKLQKKALQAQGLMKK
ncbi:phage holin [Cytobacillus praedii]|uniref:PTS mannose transporter subunit IID n=1 Tax=Cytobacillus praedii TaxID=1742358 RepID=A0A4R1AP75_9BACI|nr:phage holin [Cytobacillus praedii]TCJ01565.1 PTS mannose transporter subunit IID [Cytobacillus praedii]